MEQRPGKHCCKCKQVKPITEFNKNRTRPDGHAGQCRECTKAYMREYNNRPEVFNRKQQYNSIPDVVTKRRICSSRNQKFIQQLRDDLVGSQHRKFSKEDDNYIIQNYTNFSAPEIAMRLNRTEGSVRQRIFRLLIKKEKADGTTTLKESIDKLNESIKELLTVIKK